MISRYADSRWQERKPPPQTRKGQKEKCTGIPENKKVFLNLNFYETTKAAAKAAAFIVIIIRTVLDSSGKSPNLVIILPDE